MQAADSRAIPGHPGNLTRTDWAATLALRRIVTMAILWVPLLGVLIKPALADGGRTRLSQVVGTAYRVTVFTSPTPLRVGLVDVSILVQNERTGEIVHDAEMRVRCESEFSGRTVHQAASHAEAANRLLQSAELELDATGIWQVELQIESPVKALLRFPLSVEAETVSVSAVTLLVAMPFVFICFEKRFLDGIRGLHASGECKA